MEECAMREGKHLSQPEFRRDGIRPICGQVSTIGQPFAAITENGLAARLELSESKLGCLWQMGMASARSAG